MRDGPSKWISLHLTKKWIPAHQLFLTSLFRCLLISRDLLLSLDDGNSPPSPTKPMSLHLDEQALPTLLLVAAPALAGASLGKGWLQLLGN